MSLACTMLIGLCVLAPVWYSLNYISFLSILFSITIFYNIILNVNQKFSFLFNHSFFKKKHYYTYFHFLKMRANQGLKKGSTRFSSGWWEKSKRKKVFPQGSLWDDYEIFVLCHVCIPFPTSPKRYRSHTHLPKFFNLDPSIGQRKDKRVKKG